MAKKSKITVSDVAAQVSAETLATVTVNGAPLGTALGITGSADHADAGSAPVRSSMDADPAKTGATIHDMAMQSEDVTAQVQALKSLEPEMMAQFQGFRSDKSKDTLKRFAYWYTLRNVFVDPERGIRKIADFLRDRCKIDAADAAALKSARADWDYLRRCGEALAGRDVAGRGSKGTTPYGERVKKYVADNFKIGPDALTIDEALTINRLVTERYNEAAKLHNLKVA